jgi:hypothetical protein
MTPGNFKKKGKSETVGQTDRQTDEIMVVLTSTQWVGEKYVFYFVLHVFGFYKRIYYFKSLFLIKI